MINIISGCVVGIYLFSFFIYAIRPNKISKFIFSFIISPTLAVMFIIYAQSFNEVLTFEDPRLQVLAFALRPFLFIATICIGTDVIKNANSKIDTLINENKKNKSGGNTNEVKQRY